MSEHVFIGIDLGTSNSALAYAQSTSEKIEVVDLVQVYQPGQLIKQKTLPSVTYFPYEEERAALVDTLPWQDTSELGESVVGVWARARSRDIPERVISSAKSWLCSSHVDRLGEILPWQSSFEPKISPVRALQAYVEHMRLACEKENVFDKQGETWETLPIVLTVPASFDEVARRLTHQAAIQAGLGNVTLLEEPLAAFYSWLAHNEASWRKEISVGDLILVCDVGGGTTDFSLIAVSEESGNLKLERVSVGEHLLLGGDNMDLALAYTLKARLAAEQQVQLDAWQFASLINSAREAKEKLLSDKNSTEVSLAIASRGAKLFAKTLSITLRREEVERVLLEGFFPLGSASEEPRTRQSSAIQEFGLPYESDPAITRHLARFLRRSKLTIESNPGLRELFGEQLRHTVSSDGNSLLPTAILFNGGVFNSALLQERMVSLLTSWAPMQALKVLQSTHLDLAVAHGAAYFAKQKVLGQGIRLRAGTAKSYYIGVETAMMAVPGIEPELKGLCVLPQGSEEGSSFSLANRQFGLVTGQESRFRFFSSAIRAGDTVGTVVENCPSELEETAELHITLPPLSEGKTGEVVPVKLDATITEVGTLKVYMQHLHSPQRWEVEFNVRTP